MKSEMLEFLRQYIHETPKEIIQKEWAQIEQLSSEGVKASEYIAILESQCFIDNHDPRSSQIIFEENVTPKYSGSYFLRNIVV